MTGFYREQSLASQRHEKNCCVVQGVTADTIPEIKTVSGTEFCIAQDNWRGFITVQFIMPLLAVAFLICSWDETCDVQPRSQTEQAFCRGGYFLGTL